MNVLLVLAALGAGAITAITAQAKFNCQRCHPLTIDGGDARAH